MVQVTEINSPVELGPLRPAWESLLAETWGATFFQSLDWLEAYWQYFGDRQELRVLIIESESRLTGILPLAITTEATRAGHVRVLGYPLAGWGSFYGPIGPDPEATLIAGLNHIARTPRNWDLFDLRWVDEELDRTKTPATMAQAGFKNHRAIWHSSAQANLSAGWKAYWGTRSSHFRNNVSRSERFLATQGSIEHVRYRPKGAAAGDADPRWDLYDTCVELAGRSWQGSSTSGTTLSHGSVRDYLRAAHASATNAGAVDLNLLLVNSCPVAFAYNYCWNGWVYGLRSGFDRSQAEDGAGTVLMARMIEDSCRRGDRLIDLGPNYLDCKRHWLTQLKPAYHYTYFQPLHWRAQAIRLKKAMSKWLVRTTHRTLAGRTNADDSTVAAPRAAAQ